MSEKEVPELNVYQDLKDYLDYLESLKESINKNEYSKLPNIDYLCSIGIDNVDNFDEKEITIVISNFLKFEFLKVDILLKTYANVILENRIEEYKNVFKQYQEEFKFIQNEKRIKITCPVMLNSIKSKLNNNNDNNFSKRLKVYDEYNIIELLKNSGKRLLTIQEIETLNYNTECECGNYDHILYPTEEQSSKNGNIPIHIYPKKNNFKIKYTVENAFNGAAATAKVVLQGLKQAPTALGSLTKFVLGVSGGKKSRKRKHNKLKKKRKSTRKKRRKSNKKHR